MLCQAYHNIFFKKKFLKILIFLKQKSQNSQGVKNLKKMFFVFFFSAKFKKKSSKITILIIILRGGADKTNKSTLKKIQ